MVVAINLAFDGGITCVFILQLALELTIFRFRLTCFAPLM